ncbi:MAG: ATPase, T2SS/T4P/T4SS family [Patescibacteria group bacterium]
MQANQNLLLKGVLAEAVKFRAADLHFSVGNAPLLRIDGQLTPMADQAVINQDFMKDLINLLLTDAQKDTLKERKELIFTYDFEKGLRFKVNIFYQQGFLSATFRYISPQTPTIDSLGLEETVKKIAGVKKGLVIISGNFGSGRSSTAASIIEEINQTRKEYIIAVEDPIEYIFTNKKSIIEQREVGKDTNSYADAINYFQEEDGDVLFLDQADDPKIIPSILELARAGSLVITVMSADSASKTVSRILDSFQSFDQERIRNLLATSLKAILCQKLLPKSGGGLVVVQEIMMVNDAIKSIIASGNIAQLDTIIQTSRKENMISFNQSLAELYGARRISLEDALENATDKKTFENLIQ